MSDEKKRQYDEVKAWVEVQKKIHPEFEAPDLSENPDGVPVVEGSVLATIGEVLGVPRQLVIAGLVITLTEPRVRDLKQLILDLQIMNMDGVDATQTGIDVIERLMLKTLTFDKEPENRVEWFEELSATDGVKLAAEYSKCFDLQALMKQVNTLFGKK